QKRQLKAQKPTESTPTQTTAEDLDTVYVPSLSVLFRFLALVRISGALLSPIQDCDEVFNYWEPLHMLQFGTGKQTWEYAPQYALRSYGFLHIYGALVRMVHFALGLRAKAQVFYALRVCMALASALCEAVFVRAVARHVDRRVGNHTALALFGMAGLFHAAPALLPSSFAMCVGTLGSAAAMAPPVANVRQHLRQRAVPATVAFAVAACAGWPYAAIVAVPFVLEELLVKTANGSVAHDGDSSPTHDGSSVTHDDSGGIWRWRVRRLAALAGISGGTAAAVLGAMAAVDSWYYGRPVVAAWNQVAYNVLGRHGGTSTLYGTEPWYFYVKNGLLNANVVMVLALAALPMWAACFAVQTGRMGARGLGWSWRGLGWSWVLLFRMAPFYVVLGLFSLQAHKEERFLSIVYPQLCFCAAVALRLAARLRACVAVSLGRRVRGGEGRLGFAVLAVAACVGVLRMAALAKYYGAPVRAFMELPPPAVPSNEKRLLPLGPTIKSLLTSGQQPSASTVAEGERVVCMGGAWYWFPSSYWLPAGYRLQFVRGLGAVDGHLPGDYVPARVSGSVRASTSAARADFNAQNRWEASHAAELFGGARSVCDFVVGIEYPQRGDGSGQMGEWQQQRQGGGWQRQGECHPVLDPEGTSVLARMVYMPPTLAWAAGQRQAWGQICVYRQVD
ncbi:mannosyltransferase, partial [Coemansia erecta]